MVDQTLETTECERTPRLSLPPTRPQRQAAPPVVVYTVDKLPPYDRAFYDNVRRDLTKVSETIVPPRDARTFSVPAGHLFRIVSIEGPQVGDLNLWNAHDLSRALLLRQDARAARDPCDDRRPAVEHAAVLAAARDDHARHARLVRLRRRRRRHPRRHRHALRSLHAAPARRHRVSSLLPLEPDARAQPRTPDCRSPRPSATCTTCSTSSCAPASRATRTSIS